VTSGAANLYRALLENLLDGVMVIGFDGSIRFANSAACRMFGRRPEEVVGRSFGEVFVQFDEFDEFTEMVLDAVRNRSGVERRVTSVRIGDAAIESFDHLRTIVEQNAATPLTFVVERDDIHDEVMSYAHRVAANAPLTLRAAKAAVDAWERGGQQDDLDGVRQLVNACFDSEDYREGRRAFAEKRPPRFAGR